MKCQHCLVNSLALGCDCLGEIYYFDVTVSDSRGGATSIPNAVCMHEEDFGILWKHVDSRTGQTEDAAPADWSCPG